MSRGIQRWPGESPPGEIKKSGAGGGDVPSNFFSVCARKSVVFERHILIPEQPEFFFTDVTQKQRNQSHLTLA